MNYTFTAKLWLYNGQGAWHFVTLPPDVSADIKEVFGANKTTGFGAVKVQVVIGTSTWQTSVFPDSKSGCYILPVKKAIRLAEDLQANEEIACSITIL